MRTVDITYSWLWKTRTMHIEVPERWEDLKPYQFEVCAQLHISPPADNEFVLRFFRIPKRVVARLDKFQIYKLTDMVAFAVTPSATTSQFFMAEIPGTGLLSPGNKLGNVSLEQFALLDTYFFKYANEPTDQRLCEFVASVYLKKSEVLTKIDFTQRANYIAKNVDKCTLYAIFLNYLFVRKWLTYTFKYLFNADEPEENTKKRRFKVPEKPLKKQLPRWVEIIEGFVGDDILHYDEYTAMNCVRAFKVINNRIKNYQKNGR